jgi:hypothetical protein
MILSISLDDLQLQFQVLDTPLANLWVERMQQREAWPLDDPKRFYGFNAWHQEQQFALDKINYCINLIKSQMTWITQGHVTQVDDQDSLNYWHHIFETQHGLLEQEDTSHPLTPVLANLNIAVHRCESTARGNRPRFVCTWFGMPKTKTLPVEVMHEFGTLNPKFGSVCLNYAEIGKTLEDLTQDRDHYISDHAFLPFNHYSADFNVRMHEETADYVADKLVRMQAYYNQHREFFFDQGFVTFQDPRLLPLRFPVAELIETMPRHELLTAISQHQQVTQVTIQ